MFHKTADIKGKNGESRNQDNSDIDGYKPCGKSPFFDRISDPSKGGGAGQKVYTQKRQQPAAGQNSISPDSAEREQGHADGSNQQIQRKNRHCAAERPPVVLQFIIDAVYQ